MSNQDGPHHTSPRFRLLSQALADAKARPLIVRDARITERLCNLYVEVLDCDLPPAIRALLDRARR
jgi:hypothetical protein